MLTRWPIRNKLLLGVAILVVSVGILAFSGFRGAYSYRDLARSVTVRAKELPLAADLTQRVGDLRVALSRLRDARSNSKIGMATVDSQLLREDFRMSLMEVEEALTKDVYKRQQLHGEQLGPKSHYIQMLGRHRVARLLTDAGYDLSLIHI